MGGPRKDGGSYEWFKGGGGALTGRGGSFSNPEAVQGYRGTSLIRNAHPLLGPP